VCLSFVGLCAFLKDVSSDGKKPSNTEVPQSIHFVVAARSALTNFATWASCSPGTFAQKGRVAIVLSEVEAFRFFMERHVGYDVITAMTVKSIEIL
jgi:hypothetical protein